MDLEGLLLIDGVDAYTAYKAVVVLGGHKGLLGWPSLKEVEVNNWHEEDGLEADLSSPVLASKEFPVDFYVFGADSVGIDNLRSLVSALRDGSYHTMTFAQIGRSAKLRVVSFGEPDFCDGGLLVSITFADDFPLGGYEYLSPSSSEPLSTDYQIDNTPFTAYGVRIIEGSLKSAVTMADVKPNLLRNISILPGVIYDDPAEDENATDTTVRLAYREVVLRCCQKAPTLSAFWRNFDALLHDLSKPGARTLAVSATNSALTCHYVSQEVEDYSIDNGVFVKFSVTLAVMGSATEVERLLSSEDWKYIITEDGKKIPVKVYQ